jgi:hypothetical protein
MKNVLVCLLAVGLLFTFSPVDAGFGDWLSDVVNSGVNNVSGVFNNAISSLSNTIDTISFVSTFLWDNALGPAVTTLQQSKKNIFLRIDVFVSNPLYLTFKID